MKFIELSNELINADAVSDIQLIGSEIYIFYNGSSTAGRIIGYADAPTAAASFTDMKKQLK